MKNNTIEEDIPQELLEEIAAKAYAKSIFDDALRSGWLHKEVMKNQSSSRITPEEFAQYRRLYRLPKKDDEAAYKRHKRYNFVFPAAMAAASGLVGAGTGAMYGDMAGESPGVSAATAGVISAAFALAVSKRALSKRNKQLRAELALGRRWPSNAKIQVV